MLTLYALHTISNICFKTIYYTTAKSVALITHIISENKDFHLLNELMIKTDIFHKMKKMNQLIIDIDHKYTNCMLQESLKLSIDDLNDIIKQINQVFEMCIQSKKQHELLYFNQWRSYDITEQIKKIQLYIDIFNIRYDDFVKMVMLVNYLF